MRVREPGTAPGRTRPGRVDRRVNQSAGHWRRCEKAARLNVCAGKSTTERASGAAGKTGRRAVRNGLKGLKGEGDVEREW